VTFQQRHISARTGSMATPRKTFAAPSEVPRSADGIWEGRNGRAIFLRLVSRPMAPNSPSDTKAVAQVLKPIYDAIREMEAFKNRGPSHRTIKALRRLRLRRARARSVYARDAHLRRIPGVGAATDLIQFPDRDLANSADPVLKVEPEARTRQLTGSVFFKPQAISVGRFGSRQYNTILR
jgi:hypothetical protein